MQRKVSRNDVILSLKKFTIVEVMLTPFGSLLCMTALVFVMRGGGGGGGGVG